ncbi:MAG: hypothetical protein ACLQCB_14950 [Spirochaetia bacterium]
MSRAPARGRPASRQPAPQKRPRKAAKRPTPSPSRRPRPRSQAPRLPVEAPQNGGRPALGARTLLPLAAGAALALAILWIPFAPFVSPKPSRVWRGYHTILVREGSHADALLSLAAARLGPGVISEPTATVDFYDFSSSIRFPYAQLAKRLDSLDPRRDPYIDRMAGFFSFPDGAEELHALYVPARSTSFALFMRLWRLWGPCGRDTWRLADFDPLEKLLSVLALTGFATVMTLGGGKRRRGSPALAFAASLLWLPAILAGGPSVLALCVLLLSFHLPLVRARLAAPGKGPTDLRKTKDPLFLYLGAGALALGVFFVLNGCSLALLIQPLAPFACSLLLVLLVPFFSRVAEGRRKAMVFAPVPILKNGADQGKGRQKALALALFSIIFVVLVPLLRDGAFPAPVPVWGARGFSWDAVASLQRGPKADRLPDFSDFVAHEAYQQTLGLGRKWKEPVRDERIYYREYLVDPASGVVHARLLTVKVLDSTWLRSLTAHPAPTSVEALLLAQGRPVAAAVRGPARALAGELVYLALVFCSILLLLGWDLRAGLLIRGNLWRLNGAARRDQIS